MILRDNSIVRTLTYKESMYGANISKEKAIDNSDGWTCVTGCHNTCTSESELYCVLYVLYFVTYYVKY